MMLKKSALLALIVIGFNLWGLATQGKLLAARALVYSKLIAKDEILPDIEPYPHTRDELEVGATTARLLLSDCRRLYPLIRRASTAVAREMVQHYLDGGRPGREIIDSWGHIPASGGSW
mgnify:CR=1 FL=1